MGVIQCSLVEGCMTDGDLYTESIHPEREEMLPSDRDKH